MSENEVTADRLAQVEAVLLFFAMASIGSLAEKEAAWEVAIAYGHVALAAEFFILIAKHHAREAVLEYPTVPYVPDPSTELWFTRLSGE